MAATKPNQFLTKHTIHAEKLRNGVWIAVDPNGNMRWLFGKLEWKTKAACEADILRMYSAQLAFGGIK